MTKSMMEQFDDSPTHATYQQLCTETQIYPREHAVFYPALGLAGEAGEVANKIKKIISQFKKKKIRTSLFVNPNIKDIYLSKEIGADCIEIHTGHFSNLIKSKKSFIKEFLKIKKCAILASKIGVEVHAGHGLDFKSTKILTKINEIVEFNIGHFIIGESIFYGLPFVIKKFKRIIKN